MVIADIKQLPKLGDHVVMENSVHGEVERLKAVLIVPDDELDNMVHVFFASDEPTDNVHMENGVPYYSIVTYAQLGE